MSEDRVTEVGIIEVDQDGVYEWSSLVNPGVPIPPFIQSLTGISNAMVERAPSFAQLADEISTRLSGRTFIAHNARFDYGFLKHEFRRTGHEFNPPVLCTVRLSRKLFPDFEKHNLDAIAERHHLTVIDRHRALGDARLIWQFWQRIHQQCPRQTIEDTVTRLIKRPTLPPRFDSLQIEAMPFTPGVYLFYGANALPLYVGKANNLRRRVLAHFSNDHLSAREQQMTQQVERVEWRETGGEIGALLQEAVLIKQLMPAYNHQLRSNERVCAWRTVRTDGRLQPVLAYTDDLFFCDDPALFGLFSCPQKAREALHAIAAAHGLCPVRLKLEKGPPHQACFASQVGKCRGVCVGRETPEAHDARLMDALQRMRVQPWPFAGAIGLQEGAVCHVLDGWSYLGCATSEDARVDLLSRGRHRFDRDVYQILHKRLPRLSERIVEFAADTLAGC